MTRFSGTLAVALVALSLASLAQAADTINRRSDKRVSGEITAIAKESVTVKNGIGETVVVPANDIVNIEWDSEPNDLNLARGSDERGDLDRAIELYTKSAAAPEAKGNVKADIEFLLGRAIAQQALEGDVTRLDDAIKKLSGFTKANGDSYRFYDAIYMLGRAQLAKEDFAGAETSFQQLQRAPWTDYKMAGQNAIALLALTQGNLSSAQTAYDGVLSQNATTPAEISSRNVALLGIAKVHLQQKKPEDALKSVGEALSKADAEDSAVQAEAFVLKGECLKALGRSKEALLAYLAVPVLFEREKVHHAQALFNLAMLAPKLDDPELGLKSREELQSLYPDSQWAQKLQ
jgi:tetratricopeptide (TPR) repeat protein